MSFICNILKELNNYAYTEISILTNNPKYNFLIHSHLLSVITKGKSPSLLPQGERCHLYYILHAFSLPWVFCAINYVPYVFYFLTIYSHWAITLNYVNILVFSPLKTKQNKKTRSTRHLLNTSSNNSSIHIHLKCPWNVIDHILDCKTSINKFKDWNHAKHLFKPQ